MDKLFELFGDISKLWLRSGTQYLDGAKSTIILAVVATAVGCIIGLGCGILQTIPSNKTDNPVKKVILRTMALSGGLCGITGLLLVAGTDHTITTTTIGGIGFTAIMVSWLAKFNPIIMTLTSFLIVFLERGAGEIATTFQLNHSISDILTGIILFFIIGSEFFVNYKITLRKKHKEEA